MQKDKLILGLIFVLLLGLCVSLVASDRDIPLQRNPNRMNRLHSVPKEAKLPLTPDNKLPGDLQKPCHSSAAAGTGAIRGRVTQAPGGTTPIENVAVTAFELTCPNYGAYAYSGSDGYYVIDSLPGGKYAVWTYNDSIFLDIFWNDKWTWATIDTVVVVSNDTTENINFKLPVGGRITGRVTMLGASFSFVTVTAYDTLSDNDYEKDVYIDFDSASYEIKKIQTGIYKVYTTALDSFAPEYYNNKPDWASAYPVRVKQDSITSNIDFTLSVGGKITGKIKLPGASSVMASVSATDTTTGNSYNGASINPSGDSVTYEIVGLPTGTYKVNTYGNSQGYLDEYYNDKPDWESANPIRVKQDSITSNINFTLALGGKITGKVKLPGASSVSATINATETTTKYPYWVYQSNPSGDSVTYEIVGLPTGTYKVYTNCNSQSYLDEYYNGKSDYDSADTIHVTAGSIRSSINFTLTIGGIIKGTISSSAKGLLKNIPVYAYCLAYPSSWGYSSGFSDLSGNYRLRRLRSGWWRIRATGDTTYAFEYYNDKSSWFTADSVLVAVSDSVTGKDFSLEVGGSISGHVYGEGGLPLSGVNVTAYSLPETPLGFFTKVDATSEDGSYKIGGLRTGWYKVEINYCGSMFYNNKSSLTAADSVHVTMPDNTPGINFNYPSAVGDEENQTTSRPAEFELNQNYPNPFNPSTKIEFALLHSGFVSLDLYDILGRKVRTLVSEYMSSGYKSVLWDGKNDDGKDVTSGIYFYRLTVGDFSEAKKMLLLK